MKKTGRRGGFPPIPNGSSVDQGPMVSTPSNEKDPWLFFVLPKEALLCYKEFSVFVLQFNSPRQGLDLRGIPIISGYAEQNFAHFVGLARYFELVKFRYRIVGSYYSDKNT